MPDTTNADLLGRDVGLVVSEPWELAGVGGAPALGGTIVAAHATSDSGQRQQVEVRLASPMEWRGAAYEGLRLIQ